VGSEPIGEGGEEKERKGIKKWNGRQKERQRERKERVK
jgi:hypothetical protein